MSYTAVREYRLHCDGGDGTDLCEEWFARTGAALTVTRLRELAAQKGWTTIKPGRRGLNARDYCPEHKPGEEHGDGMGK